MRELIPALEFYAVAVPLALILGSVLAVWL